MAIMFSWTKLAERSSLLALFLSVSTSSPAATQSRISTLQSIGSKLFTKVEECYKNAPNSEQLRSRPGFAFGLGCDEWAASQYTGIVEGWTAAPKLSWLSRGLMKRASNENKLDAKLDMLSFLSPLTDVPHFRLSVAASELGYSIFLDYVPREELLASIEYYDRYFLGVEEQQYQSISKAHSEGKLLRLQPTPESALTRMLLSPFAIRADVGPEDHDVVDQFCSEHVDRWCEWVKTAKAIDDIQKNTVRFNRDISLQKLLYEDLKFSLAVVMGADFAPKAEELAASVIGPPIGPKSYADFLLI